MCPISHFILTWRRGRRDQQGGSLRMRPRHCTPLGLRPAISSNVGNSGAEFLVVGVRVRAAPDIRNKEKTGFFLWFAFSVSHTLVSLGTSLNGVAAISFLFLLFCPFLLFVRFYSPSFYLLHSQKKCCISKSLVSFVWFACVLLRLFVCLFI